MGMIWYHWIRTKVGWNVMNVVHGLDRWMRISELIRKIRAHHFIREVYHIKNT